MKRIFSGMQPTAHLHLGNYLGALRNWVKLQDGGDFECIYCVVDLHAITAGHDPDVLAGSTREIAAAYIAAGVDPSKTVLFAQSAVPAHVQLMWLLSSMTQMGKLSRMTQFKDKAGKNSEKAGLGLFSYPVLMAADILLYHATHVPVGEDQKQHVELTREVAGTFNHRYGAFFPLPEPLILGAATRVMSLRDGTKKMSKSDASDMSRINLTDTADQIAAKIRKAKTDPLPFPETLKDLEDRPEAANLITIYAAVGGLDVEQVLSRYAGGPFSGFKQDLADLLVEHVAPITSRMNALLAAPEEIDRILAAGAEKAQDLAAPVMDETFRRMGFWNKG